VRVDQKADEGEYDESGCYAEEQQGGLNDSANVLENCSAPLMSETSLLPVPGTGSELHSGDDIIEAKSLPNLRSHIHDLERSDSVQLSRSLRSNPENNCIEPVNNMNFTEKEPEATSDDSIEAKSLPNLRSHIHDLERSDSVQLSRSLCCNPENNCSETVNDMNFTEKEPEATSDPKENIKAAELTSNSMPEDKHIADLKVDSFNPVAGEFSFLLGDNIVEFDYSSSL
jgi:hypothetical protein